MFSTKDFLFSFWISLDPSTPEHIIRERVTSTVVGLGLMDVAHNRIGNAVQRGISGGQKRRVTIGSSLVTLPKILFLDEPTSGLDSKAGWEVVKYLKEVARRNNVRLLLPCADIYLVQGTRG